MLSDWGILARFLLALAVVLALIAVATWAARRYLATGMMGTLGGKRRLAVIEHAFLDGKSRLVLVRRDNVEHLLVLGPAGAVVIESAISAGEAVPDAPPQSPAETPRAVNLRALFKGQR